MERENAVRQQSNQYRMQKEERDTALAIENSKKTFAEEEARRRKEESDLALAIENSKKTFAEEEARRAAPSSHVVVPHVSEVSLTPATAPAAEWEPNSGDMYNAGKYIMDYKNELHRNPTSNEIKQRLQSKMPHLSSVQIDKIMDDMGV